MTELQTTRKDSGMQGRNITFKATQVVWLLLGILEALFALRFVLRLIGANPSSPVAAFIYGFTGLFLFPFAGLTGTPSMGSMVLEVSTLIAMAVYALLAWGLERLVWVIFYRPRGSSTTVTQTDTIERDLKE